MSDEEPEIHRAARRGETATLERLIAAGVDINLRYDVALDQGSQLQQLTPLMTAARSLDGADAETITWLLANGADLRAVSRGGVTAAWYAAGKGGRWWSDPWHKVPSHAARLQCLLDAGLDPHEVSRNGRSLMAEACFAGDHIAVQLLLERGVSVEPVPGIDGETSEFRTTPPSEFCSDELLSERIPLFGAVESGSLECVELLLAHGARLDRVDGYDNDVLDVALTQDHYYGKEYKAPPPVYLTIAKRLLEAGVPVDRTRHDGKSRLYWIAFCQQLYGIAFLLEHGASLAPDARGWTPLSAVCWHGSSRFRENPAKERMIRMLVEAGVPLDRAAMQLALGGDVSSPEAVRVLLELGSDPNDELDDEGNQLLYGAVEAWCPESVCYLLQHGANPTHRNHKGETPLDLAKCRLPRHDDSPRLAEWSRKRGQSIIAQLEDTLANPLHDGDTAL